MRLLIALLITTAAVFAQGTTSRVLGVVQDPTGAAVPGATVQLRNEATGAVFTTRTSETGAYVFEAVQSGSYTITVEATGFKRFVSRGNQVTIGQPTTVNVTLEVGALAEQIEVSASYELVQTSTSGNIGNLFTDRMIRDLPLVGTRGRNPLTLVLLQPGVVSGANTGGGVHVHGARDRAWNFTLDGIDINETSAGGSNFSPLRTNPDSLAEFRVLTSSFTADYGRNSGGQVTMITRSGSNEFHGSGFWFYRTPRLNANEWENNLNNVGKRQFVQHIWGGSLGGPIVRNKTFFFANVQLLRALQTGIVNRTVYTAEARRGILRYVRGGRNRPAGVPDASVDAAGNVLPGVNIGVYNVATSDPERLGLDKTIQALLAQTPLPNNFTGRRRAEHSPVHLHRGGKRKAARRRHQGGPHFQRTQHGLRALRLRPAEHVLRLGQCGPAHVSRNSLPGGYLPDAQESGHELALESGAQHHQRAGLRLQPVHVRLSDAQRGPEQGDAVRPRGD
jgi:hypothetical protein